MNNLISIIIVNYNAIKYLLPCLESVTKINKGDYRLEIILVDNLSQDGSIAAVREKFPDVKIIENNVNSYARAVNLGIQSSTGAYVVFLNPDTVVDKDWLMELMEIVKRDVRIGGVQSKILFFDGKTINSVGGESLNNYYFQDAGFGEEDKGQYEEINEPEFVSGGSVLYRRTCLDDVGGIDEDFVMYYEDVDYSIRCRDKGWKLFYAPKSIVYHKFHGVTSNEICGYYSSRNRLLLVGKYFPHALYDAIKTSQYFIDNDLNNLYHSLIQAVKKMAENQPDEMIIRILDDWKDIVIDVFGVRIAINFFRQLEVLFGLRKMKIGIYGQVFHYPGGGQRYAATMAACLQDQYDVTLIANKDMNLGQYKEWFDIDLSGCELKIIKIPFYEKKESLHIDEGMAADEEDNPFDIISDESINYDIFVNTNMLTKVKPLSNLGIFISHFPERGKEKFFSVDQYDYIFTNSNYGSYWLKQKWGFDAAMRLYPPVNMYNGKDHFHAKSNIILSVARFEPGGSKKQLEMIRAFRDICAMNQCIRKEWRLIIAGSSEGGNAYFKKVKEEIDGMKDYNIELMSDLTNSEILKLYEDASIFWHACGLKEDNPHLVEHFGMTTVEAMQNYCAPIVINGGGQKEIVEHGVSGFLFNTEEELISWTLKVIENDELRKKIAQGAFEKSHQFSADVFKKNVNTFFANLERRLKGGEPLDVRNNSLEA
jgi:GT2 family glycosyltransferase